MESKVNYDKIRLILSKFFKLTNNEKEKLPSVLSQGFLDFFTYLTEEYVIVSFITEKEGVKVKKLTNEGYPPYPGLIAPKNIKQKVAFNVVTSKNNMFNNINVKKYYAFKIDVDSTLILIDFKHLIDVVQIGLYEYNIEFAFILTFGTEITPDNFYIFLEELVDYFLLRWESTNVR